MFLVPPVSLDSKTDSAWRSALDENRIDSPIQFAEFMLLKTSRTFALNIQVLPSGLRKQVLLAYLFCRIADTLEDDATLERNRKISLLKEFATLFPPGPHWESQLATFIASLPKEWSQSEKWDPLLVAHCRWIFPLLNQFSADVIKAISTCVREMTEGMVQFTKKQMENSAAPVLVETVEDLNRYCYYVAGTVGNMLCDLFAYHSKLISKKRALQLKQLSVSFGLGLQLTNILKDISDDRQRNISYIPLSMLREENLTERAFLEPEGHLASARIMAKLIRKTKIHLTDALEYTCLLPRMEPRLRLFCLWPLFMALETIAMLANNLDGIDGTVKMKISRAQVKKIVRQTSLACWSNQWLHAMFQKTMQGLDTQLKRVESSTATLQPGPNGSVALGAHS